MDYYFDQGYLQLRDSMTEREFRMLLSFVATKIRCGHTSVRASRKYMRYLDTSMPKIFPINLKVWSDTMVVTSVLSRKDSTLKRGSIVTSIDGRSSTELIDTFMNYLTGDGNAVVGKFQSLSNRGNFATLYRNLYGLPDSLHINYIDSTGMSKAAILKAYDPKDSTGRLQINIRKPDRREMRYRELLASRNIQIDMSLNSAYMSVNTFSRGNRLRGFFRRSFRTLDKMGIKHLVLDVRTNGGGDAGNSTLLTQYLVQKKFKLADSLYAVKRTSRYSSYIKWQPVYWLMMQFVTKKKADGKYHFGYFERHYFKPRKRHHFDGNVYILTGGNSFSATTLFIKPLQGQPNVKVIGEETGGGAYGNSAWMIPDVILPNTGVRFRLPKFRLVMDKDLVREGRGVIPDVYVGPTVETIRKGIDPKIEAVRDIIKQSATNSVQR